MDDNAKCSPGYISRLSPFHPESLLIDDWETSIDMNPFTYINASDSIEEDDMLAKLRYKINQDFIRENNAVGIAKQDKLHIQGLINLADNHEDDGGFQIVAG